MQSFLRGWLCRRKWKTIIQDYIRSPHADSMRKRNQVVFSMLEAEAEYVQQLHILVNNFLRPLRMAASSKKPPITHDDVSSIFLNRRVPARAPELCLLPAARPGDGCGGVGCWGSPGAGSLVPRALGGDSSPWTPAQRRRARQRHQEVPRGRMMLQGLGRAGRQAMRFHLIPLYLPFVHLPFHPLVCLSVKPSCFCTKSFTKA